MIRVATVWLVRVTKMFVRMVYVSERCHDPCGDYWVSPEDEDIRSYDSCVMKML